MITSDRSEVTYAWLTGHVRNVGDSVLRRAYLQALRQRGRVVVWSGAPRSGYEAGLELKEGEPTSSFRAWARELRRLRGPERVNFAFNAGAFSVTKEYFSGLLRIAPWLLMIKARGGRIIWLGAGVASRKGAFTLPFDVLARAADHLAWRDVDSPALMRIGGLMPDWAFGLDSGGGWNSTGAAVPAFGERHYLAVSLRGDREAPTEEWIDAVRRLAVKLKLKLVFVAQVSDDSGLAGELAKRLSAECVSWVHDNHAEQEALVRDWYRKSAVLVSDRLHGLIMAATEGCVPLGWTSRPPRKLAVHLDVVGAGWATVNNSEDSLEQLATLDSEGLRDLWHRTQKVVDEARRAVHRRSTELTTGAVDGVVPDA